MNNILFSKYNFILFFFADDLPKDAISSLPASRQRNSLLAVGKNLLNIPDEDPEPCRIIRSTSISELAKPLKKRLITGFNFDDFPDSGLKRSAPTSLIDLSNACEAERQKIRRQSPLRPNASNMIRISPQNHIRRSHIISPINNSGVTLLRKPLSPLTSLIRQNGLNGKTHVISVMPPTLNNSIIDLSKRKY